MSPWCPRWLKKMRIRKRRIHATIASTDRQNEDISEMSDVRQPQLKEYNKRDIALLHPDWRNFPHTMLFGWTSEHAQKLKDLNNMIVYGSLESAYYDTEAEYKAACFWNQYSVLPRPIVNDVNEAIQLLRRSSQFQNYSWCEITEYDADDESEDKPRWCSPYHNRSRRRYRL